MALLCSVIASAYDFEVDGIYYNIIGENASVTYRMDDPEGSNIYEGNVVIPGEVTYNGKRYCVTEIGETAFACSFSLTSVTIPESVTTIGEGAFTMCHSLTSITIPESVTAIGREAFSSCSSLASIKIPDGVTVIEKGMFTFCDELTSITLPASITKIGDAAFYECISLTGIYLTGTTPPALEDKYFFYGSSYATLYVPRGSLATYQATEVWKEVTNMAEYDTTDIDGIEATNPAIEITTYGIRIANGNGKPVAVYTASGTLVEKSNCYTGEHFILTKGVYIVRTGNKAVKIRI